MSHAHHACFLVLAGLLAGCIPPSSNPDGGSGGGSGGGTGGGTGGGSALVWSLKRDAIIALGASAVVGNDSTLDPGGADTHVDLPASRTFHAAKTGGGASADSQMTLSIDDHQLTLTSTQTASSPGLPQGAQASGTLKDLGVCVTAPAGVKKIRVTYSCTATASYSGHGGAFLTVAAGAISYCAISRIDQDVPHDDFGTLVAEYDYTGDTDCWSEGTTFTFGAGGGGSVPGGSSTVTGTATIRFDPVY